MPLKRRRKKTMRGMTPLAKELAKIMNDLVSVGNRLDAFLEKVNLAEHKAIALDNFMVDFAAEEGAEADDEKATEEQPEAEVPAQTTQYHRSRGE